MRDALGARIADYWIDIEVSARTSEVAYRTTHRMLPRCARIAVLRPELVGNRDAELQLMREARILEMLHHCGVPRVFECGVLEHRLWIATEYIEGATIQQAAAERPLPIGDALAVIRDGAAVLAHAHHRRVVHRHLTPAAIVRTPTRGFPICITDWGRASINDRGGPPVVEADARFYCPPEVILEGRGDSAADVYALGAIMFEAITLVLPEPMQKFPGVPEPVHQLLASMLAHDAGDRPTAAAVHSEATRLVELFAEGGAAIEEVEVELVDISSSCPAMPNLGWMPQESMPNKKVPAASWRRRRDP